jgi:hypothetical protein
MVEGCQDIGFSFKVAHQGLPHGGIANLADHFLDRHPLYHVWKMQVPRPVNSAHAPYTNNSLDQVTVCQGGARLELLVGSLNGASL